MTVLGAREAVRPIDDAVTEKVGPVRPGEICVPLLAVMADKAAGRGRVDVGEIVRADAERALARAERRVESARNSATLAALAQTHATLGDAEAAVNAAREAIELSFDVAAAVWVDPSSARIAAEILTRYGHAAFAYEVLGRAPVTASLCVTFASAAIALGKHEEAQKALAPYDNWAIAAYRGYMYAASEDFDKAVGQLRRALRDEPDDADSLLNLAISLWNLGSVRKATRAALRATRSAPGRKDISLFYLEMLLVAEDVERLADEIALLNARKVIPDAKFLEVQARTCLLKGEWVKAISKLVSAGEEAGNEGDRETEGRIRSNLVRIKYVNQRLSRIQASEELAALVVQFPGNDVVAVNFAEVASKRREASLLRKALSHVEGNTTAIRRAYLRHQIAALEGDNATAAQAAEEWFDLERDNAMAATAALVAIGIGNEDWRKAVVVARHALERFPGNRSIINHAAYVLAMGGHAKDAIQVLEPAAGDDFVLNATLGLAYLADGQIDRGMRLYRDAADLAENVEPAWRSLMTVYQGMVVRQLGLDKTVPREIIGAIALVPVPLPEDWRDRPDFLRVRSVCVKNGYSWPPVL